MEKEKNGYYSLLWDSKEAFDEWDAAASGRDEDYVADLNLRYLYEEVFRLGRFGEQYNFEKIFLHPCIRPSTVLFRQEILSCIWENATLYKVLVELASNIFEVQRRLGRIRSIKDETGRKIFHLQMLLEFYTDMGDIFERLLLCIPQGTPLWERACGLSESVLGATARQRKVELEAYLALLKAKTPQFFLLNKNEEQTCTNAVFPEGDVLPEQVPTNEDASMTCYDFQERLEEASALFLEDYDFSVAVFQNDLTEFDRKLWEYAVHASPTLLTETNRLFEENRDFSFWPYFLFANESTFYLSCVRFRREYERSGFYFTMPKFEETGWQVQDAYDMTLGVNLFLAGKGFRAVSNDYGFSEEGGRIFLLTGANQGGKTTFLRSVGTLQCLAQIGMFVPARQATLQMVRHIHTLFGKDDADAATVGRFEQELSRMRGILERLSDGDMVLLNEPFTSTQRMVAVLLLARMLPELDRRRCVGGLVTHFHEIFEGLPPGSFFSLTAGVVGEGEDRRRTFRIQRMESYRQSYARDIAVKCGVTYEQLQEVLQQDAGQR